MAHLHNRTDVLDPDLDSEIRVSRGPSRLGDALIDGLASALGLVVKLAVIGIAVFLLCTYGCSYAATQLQKGIDSVTTTTTAP